MNKYIIIVLLILLINNVYGQEIDNLQWRIGEIEINEAHVEDEITLWFETINIPNNENVNIEIWGKINGELADLIEILEGNINNGIVEVNWIIELDMENENTNYAHEIRENGYVIIDFVFIVKYNDIIVASKILEIMSWINQLVIDKNTGEPIRNRNYFLLGPNREIIEGNTGDEGRIRLDRIRKTGYVYRIVI